MSLSITPSFVAHTTARASDMEQLKSDIQTWANNLGAVWNTFTPTVTAAGSTVPTYTASYVHRYVQIGKLVIALYNWRNTSGGTPGSGTDYLRVTYPVAAANPSTSFMFGFGFYGNSTTSDAIVPHYNSATTFALTKSQAWASVTCNDQNNASRSVQLIVIYEAASAA